MTLVCRGTLFSRRYDRELVLKPVISLKKSWGGGATVERFVCPRKGAWLPARGHFLMVIFAFLVVTRANDTPAPLVQP